MGAVVSLRVCVCDSRLLDDTFLQSHILQRAEFVIDILTLPAGDDEKNYALFRVYVSGPSWHTALFAHSLMLCWAHDHTYFIQTSYILCVDRGGVAGSGGIPFFLLTLPAE